MPSYRLLHANYRTGRKSRQLTELELITWIAYQQSADDFGVCPYSARKIQGDDPWLAKRQTGMVQRCLDTLVRVGLCGVFDDDGDPYLYCPEWQDWQRIRYPSDTTYPLPTAEALARCSEKTRALFSTHPRQRLHENVETFSPSRNRNSDLTTANANANANAPVLQGGVGGFEDFWAAYPKRKAKQDAERAWAKLKPDAELQAVILRAIGEQAGSVDWLREGGKFIPYPATWLNGHRWKDEAVAVPQVSDKTARSLGAIYGD